MVDVTTPWDPSRAVPNPPPPEAAPAASPGSDDQWEYVDPRSYSNPVTEAPIYTSGPQPAVDAPSPPPPPPPPPEAAPPPFAIPPLSTAPSPGPSVDPLASPDYHPEKGDLDIKERRSWKSWQLLLFTSIALVVGMWIHSLFGSSSSSATPGSSSGAYKLPPAAGAGAGATATTIPSGSSPAAGGSTTTTTAPSGVTTTTIAGGATATTTPVAVGPATVLVPETQLTGNWTSPAFTIAGGTWNIGWAFQCVPAPSSTPAFQIFVVNNGAAAGATPAVTSSDASGNSVTPLTSAGSQQVIVQTSPTCRWVVKVTGSSS